MAADEAGRAAQEAFPEDVQTGEEKRRWELCAAAAWLAYGYDESSQLDRWDLQLLHRSTRVYYDSSEPTGDGHVTDELRLLLRDRQVL